MATIINETLEQSQAERIRQFFGLDPWLPKQRKKIPVEFQTDEWWKKGGL